MCANEVLAQLRARLNHFYVLSRLETPSAGPPPGADGQADEGIEGAEGPVSYDHIRISNEFPDQRAG